ncbi:hypothetical protein [Croceicoccus mobilis]|uniref:Uncharacterized protein n=1 Tax=Croceicoccus mobilis TaxID=1703339 RepID=A0A916YZ98_9SPHN|nr:hypothetical protein [Croceicoccus mobilis]GGD68438.1 hypothetical protein GCM10010990_17430 [Croceicoccus mobilis]
MNRQFERADMLHAANNCRQILDVFARRLERARKRLDDGDAQGCAQLLDQLQDMLPEAARTISFDD